MSKAAVIFDFNRTLFDPTIYALYNGVKPMLEELKERRPLILFSKKGWDRKKLLEQLGIGDYFSAVYFVEKKDAESLRSILREHSLVSSESVIVGDVLSEEICVGNELGMKTVWFQQARFGQVPNGDIACLPHHTVRSIQELRDLLKQL